MQRGGVHVRRMVELRPRCTQRWLVPSVDRHTGDREYYHAIPLASRIDGGLALGEGDEAVGNPSAHLA
jgi:hypothetical protein